MTLRTHFAAVEISYEYTDNVFIKVSKVSIYLALAVRVLQTLSVYETLGKPPNFRYFKSHVYSQCVMSLNLTIVSCQMSLHWVEGEKLPIFLRIPCVLPPTMNTFQDSGSLDIFRTSSILYQNVCSPCNLSQDRFPLPTYVSSQHKKAATNNQLYNISLADVIMGGKYNFLSKDALQ